MTPLIRINIPCGLDNDISSGRGSCQEGWYEWVGRNFCMDKTVMDIGAGMCEGIKILKSIGAKEVYAQDIDERLKKIYENIIIKDISLLNDKITDIVTCFDVIEHVIEDITFFENLIRITKEKLIITTPNYSRSKAKNHFHCREYTIPQFANLFLPNELWTASPDGKIDHKLLLKKMNNYYIDMTRESTIYNEKHIPENLTFQHSTLDGLEWQHICGIFNL